MAHFAQLDENNVIIQVIVVSNDDCLDANGGESEEVGIAFCKSLLGQDTIWKQTSYNKNFRRLYAGIGYTYLQNLDVFVGLKPYPSWVLDNSAGVWVAPIPKPAEPEGYVAVWDEQDQQWNLVLQKT